MKKENVFVKVFALWLLSLWFVAVAYGDEAQEVEKSEGSSKKEIICKEDYYWIKDIIEGKVSWTGELRFECFKKGGKVQCYVGNAYNEYEVEAVDKTMNALFIDNWIVNKERTTKVSDWFDKELDKLYKENCKEVEF